MSPRNAILASSLAALIGVGALVGAPAVYAFPAYMTYWSETYPDSLSDNAASDDQGYFCVLCHKTEAGNGYNPYGEALRTSTAASIYDAFTEVEPLNSDLDPGGCSNLAEINASTQPGWTVGDDIPPPLEGNLLDPESPCVTTPADIAVDPLAINFGSVPLGEKVTGNEIVVSNVGGETLTVESLTFTGDIADNVTLGQSTPATPFDIPSGQSAIVGVVYQPTELGVETGTLDIASNDEDQPVVSVELTGEGVSPPPDVCVPIADPTKLDFGVLVAGRDSLELGTTVTNLGDTACVANVSVPNCIDGEFTLTSPASVTIDPGASTDVTVVYAPINVGIDNCRIDFQVPQLLTLTVPMEGEGVVDLPSDYEITMFRAQANTSLTCSGGRVVLDIVVENVGTEEGPALLTVTGEQNGVEFVHQVVEVTDSLEPGGTRYRLQNYYASEVGVIQWTATLQDVEPEPEVATATTRVVEIDPAQCP